MRIITSDGQRSCLDMTSRMSTRMNLAKGSKTFWQLRMSLSRKSFTFRWVPSWSFNRDRRLSIHFGRACNKIVSSIQCRQIQMRAFYFGLFFTHTLSVAPLFWWKERGKQEALVCVGNSHLKRTVFIFLLSKTDKLGPRDKDVVPAYHFPPLQVLVFEWVW